MQTCVSACAAMPAILLAFPFLPEGFRSAAFADVLAAFLSGALRPALKRTATLRTVLRSIISEIPEEPDGRGTNSIEDI